MDAERDRGDSGIIQPASALAHTLLAVPRSEAPAEGPGTVIGPYKILQLIGEGGFGSVFMAQQDQPVRRTVALKIIKLGMDTRQVVARFEQERQALAVMDHPNIAKVLDAGATASGRPFFVMELVKGEPITEYCDRNSLSIPERLELFAQVCNAVQHAHTKGIIHRDIKPSNILVTMQDGRPAAKVIDFGIAKATAARLTEKTLFTELRTLIGTPEYMSPEQAEGSMDIDTRTDVYALGVLLYELLTGTTPFSSRELRSAAYAEIQRIIREVDPPNPSTRLSQNTETIGNVAAHRRVEPRRLGSIIRGELDWIVMKALEKDRQRRYETANALAMDLQRYLVGEAVLAAPPSTAYRMRKFVRRHRGQVIAGGVVAAALVLGMIGTATGMVRANWERDRAEAETIKATENADTAITVVRDLSRYITMIELAGGEAVNDQQRRTALDTALVSYERLFALHPDDADARAMLARTHRYRANLCRVMNDMPEAERSYREASQHYTALAAAHPNDVTYRADVALTLRDFSLLVKMLGRLTQATEILDRSIGVYEDWLRATPDNVVVQRTFAMMLLDRAELDYALGRFSDAERNARRSAELYAGLPDIAARPETLEGLFQGMAEIRLATALRELGRLDEAFAVHDQSVDLLSGFAKISANRQYVFENYRAQSERALTLSRMPDRQAVAIADLDSAIAGCEKLAAQFPEIPAYRRSQGSATLYRGRLNALLGRREAAAQDLSAAVTLFEGLITKYADLPTYHSFLGQTYLALGQLGIDTQTATAWYSKSRASLEEALKRSPENFQDRKAMMDLDSVSRGSPASAGPVNESR